jgi:hypothetical protein
MTEAEVAKNGGTTRWVNNVGPSFNSAMDLKLLLEKPEELVCGLFGISVGGKLYAPAIFSVDKSAYRRVAPVIVSTANFALRARGLISGVWELKNGVEKINGNNTVVPGIRLVEHLSDEAIKEINTLFGAIANAPVDPA